MHKYAVQVTVADVRDGACSSSTLKEASSWGKVDGTSEQMLHEIRRAYALGKGVFAMKPLGGGPLIHKRREALRYVMEEPSIQAIAVGMQSEAEVKYNCTLFSGMEPPQDSAQDIDRQPRQLLIQDWCEGCGACVRRCKNHALALVDGKAKADASRCALCGYCAAVCPQFCIKVI